MRKFYLEDYLKDISNGKTPLLTLGFQELCEKINIDFTNEWESHGNDIKSIMDIQKKAIIGYEKEVKYFKSKIKEYLNRNNITNVDYPSYYHSIEEAVYHENWGYAGLAEWFTEEHMNSSSAKIIGDRIYFLENGKMVLKPQRIKKDRRDQLIRAFLLFNPDEKLDQAFHEIYMLDGTRVTMFGKGMTKREQDVMIFRRYIIPSYSFEEQASRGSIPVECIPMLKAMIATGYNVVFSGAVRSSKTTFLSTWQSYEDKNLEGVMVETDPEIPLHSMMPEAPIIQILADNDSLKNISKNLVRSDADYFIMAEARDGLALDTVLRIASKGTRRMKITFHLRDPFHFCYDVADEIVKNLGGDLDTTAVRAAKSFDYIFHFIQLKNKNQKRLKGIYELGIREENTGKNKIFMKQICRYDVKDNNWSWTNHISTDKRLLGEEENIHAYKNFAKELKKLSSNKDTEKSLEVSRCSNTKQ